MDVPADAARFVPELGAAIGFTASDLTANRRGAITKRQSLRLLASKWSLWILAALTMVLPVLTAVRWQVIAEPDRRLAAIFALSFALGAVVLVWFAGASVRDVVGRRVAAWEGRVSVVEETRREVGKPGEALEHYLAMGTERLTISYEQYRIIPNGLEWRVFWAPRSLTLLSLEPLAPIDAGLMRRQPLDLGSTCVMAVGFAIAPVCWAVGGVMALFGSPDWAAWIFLGFLVGGLGLGFALAVKWGIWRP